MILPHLPWYRIYPRFTDIVWLTSIIIRHDAEFTIAAENVRTVVHEEEQREILRFEEMNDTEDNDSIDSIDSVVSDASFSAHPNSGLSRDFRTPSLRPKQ